MLSCEDDICMIPIRYHPENGMLNVTVCKLEVSDCVAAIVFQINLVCEDDIDISNIKLQGATAV